MPENTGPRMKAGSFGACSYSVTSPRTLTEDTSTINFVLSFDEALKLNLAIDECVHQLGRYNRATAAGKSAGLMLVVHFDKRRIRVQQGRV